MPSPRACALYGGGRSVLNLLEMARARPLHALLLGFAVWLLCLPEAGLAQSEGTQRRILVVYSDQSTLTANIEIGIGMRAALARSLSPRQEIYEAFRDTNRFPGPEEERLFVEELERKYADLPIDVVVAVGPVAMGILLRHRDRFAPGVPMVFGGVGDGTVEAEAIPADALGVIAAFDAAETIALARLAQPSARRIVVFSGSAEFDMRWQQTVRDVLQREAFADLEPEFVSGLSLDGFIARAEALDPGTILLILTIFEDAEGARFTPHEAASAIAERSAAPSWGVYSTYVGDGVVGGAFETFDAIGRSIGDLALGVMNGEAAPGTRLRVPSTAVVDWSQLQRYGLREDLLPPDVVLLNYDPTTWQRYRTQIVAILAVVAAQSATIVALVVQGRRRRAAERELADRRLELAQLSRLSQLGELSGAITHELNQPLTAILANAEAGSILLRKSPPDLDEIASILSDIAADDQRASRILASLRRLMRRNEVSPVPVDLDEVVRDVEALARSEMVMRGVRLVVRASNGPLIVMGDKEQFQQVVLNLLLNAADAMADQPQATRLIEVEAAERADGWRRIVVQDSGPGLSAALRDDPFRAFVTTKDKGMGMGLSICRSIATAHGGTLTFEESPKGARVSFALPPA